LKKRILFAEDEKALQMLYREELEEEGYEVCFAGNGQEALTSFLEGKFDLVILDIRMPVMDGLEALSRLRIRPGKVPVLIHSSHTAYMDDPRSLLADGFIRKTTDLNELKAKIKELFGHINSK
jgi:two-component system, response regulator, stage 0 sporulation protein F